MKIYSVYDKEFKAYGRVINDSFADVLEYLKTTECPEDHTIYVASDAELEKCPSFKVFEKEYYGNMPIQLGYCNGFNKTLNCLEYHRDSEINLANEEFILLLGKIDEIENGVFDSAKVKAFRVPAKVAVEVYATTLHYAPCGDAFRVLVVLPRGTNVADERSTREPMLWMTNKWLLAHKDTGEAKAGAYVGIVGENVTID